MAIWKIGFCAKLGHMKMHPRVTKAAVELVKRFEGLRRRAARLPEGGWTIGYGHTLTAREGAEVTPEEAELLLFYDLSEVASRIDAWTFAPLNQNQFEALSAFAFNIGLDNFRHCTVLKRINEGQHLQAAAAMELWRKTEVDGEGLVADALVRRRAAEKAHYLTPPEGFQPSPSQVLRPIFDYSVIEAASQSHAAQRVAVVWTPLEGDQTTARVEYPAAPRPFTPTPAEPDPVEPMAVESMPVDAMPNEPLAVEPNPVETVEAPEAEEPLLPLTPIAEAAAAAIATPAPAAPALPVPAAVNDSQTAPAWQDAPAAAQPVFRGFEPPPRRFARADDAPLTATSGPIRTEADGVEPGGAGQLGAGHLSNGHLGNGHLGNGHFGNGHFGNGHFGNGPVENGRLDIGPVGNGRVVAEPLGEEPSPEAYQSNGHWADPADAEAPEHPGDFNLFDRPLAQPESPRPFGFHPVSAPALLMYEDNTVPGVDAPRPPGLSSILRDRTVLFSSVGLLGVALFTLAIFSMLVGKATLWHLLIGILGVVLITPAGVFFLMRRMGEPPSPVQDRVVDQG